MADEFIKGLTIFTGAGLGWMVLASWYRTEEFGSTDQLVAPVTVEGGNLFNGIGVALMNILFWFALFGALTFWVLIPGWRQAKSALENRRESA
jgi:hypothetical protein